MLELLHVGPAGLAVLFAATLVGAVVQGSIGFGLNLVVVPFCALVQPEALPAAMIIMALPMTAGNAALEWRHIDRPGVLWTTCGRLPGAAAGAWVVHALSAETLAIVTGGFVVVAAAMSGLARPFEPRPAGALVVGGIAGLMGTASSIGGPPIALLYQSAAGPVVRSTLGATFLIGTLVSLVALALAGEVEGWHWALGVCLMPAVAIGLLASHRVRRFVDRGWLRPCVLGFALLAGLGVMLRGLA